MGIVRKEEYLREIAAMIGKGGFEFSADSRPSMDGGRAFVGSVSFDTDRGAMNYTLCDASGATLVSAYGVRPLEQLADASLKDVRDAVRKGFAMQMKRQKAEARVADVIRSKGKPVGNHI